VKALSIQQPWAWLIVNALKDIENRDWTTDYRGILLIHAGKQMDRRFPWGKYAELAMPLTKDYELDGLVGYATLQKVVTNHTSPWFCGKYGFVLTQRHPVDLIPLRGQPGLFGVPKEIEDEIDEIRERRFWESEMKEQYQIKKEWDEYRLEGDETPPWKHGGIPL